MIREKIYPADLDSPRRELSNGGLKSVVTLLVRWYFFCRLVLDVQSSCMQTKKKKRATGADTVGDFHRLSSNVQKSLICFANEHAKERKERFGKYLKEQFQMSMDKEKNVWQKF